MASSPNLLDLIFPAPDGVCLRLPLVPVSRGYRSRWGEELHVWSDPSNSITAQSDPPEIDPFEPVEEVLSHLENRGTHPVMCSEKRSLGGLEGRGGGGCLRWLSNLRVRRGDKWGEKGTERDRQRKRESRLTAKTNLLMLRTNTHPLACPAVFEHTSSMSQFRFMNCLYSQQVASDHSFFFFKRCSWWCVGASI